MFIEIEPGSSVPIYLQLAQRIMEGVANGKLPPGTALPSVRAFAADLSMNMHTVNKAYHYLEEKNIIEIIPKKGVVIQPENIRKATAEDCDRMGQELRPVLAEALCRQMSKEELMRLTEKLINEVKGGLK